MAFDGFPPQAVEFRQGLEADNSKVYWQANREAYRRHVRAPMEELLDDLAGEFGPARLFRANRDVRFAADKSPYHTHIAAMVDAGATSYYVALKFDALIVGFGRYEADRDQRARIRDAIVDDRSGQALADMVADLEAHGFVLSGDALKTAPRGYPADHPRVHLLRRQSIVLARSWPPAPWLHTAEVAIRVAESWRAGRGVNAWLEEALSPGA